MPKDQQLHSAGMINAYAGTLEYRRIVVIGNIRPTRISQGEVLVV